MSKPIFIAISLLGLIICITGCSAPQPKPLPQSTEPPQSVEPPKPVPPLPEPQPQPPQPEPPPPEPEPVLPEPQPAPPKPQPPPPEPEPLVDFHDKCAPLLTQFVDSSGKVDYSSIKKNKRLLNKPLDDFEHLDPNLYKTWPKEDQIAFWINAYNIELIKIIADNYPIQSSRILRLFWPPNSIRHIKGLWTDFKFLVMDEQFTLTEVQQRFLEKFDEPRIWLAVCNASASSPPLRNEPYYGRKLYQQLDDQTAKFLASPKGFKIDKAAKTVYLSAIFEPDWFGSRFLAKYATDKKFKDQPPAVRAVLNFITNYIPKDDARFLEIENYSVDFLAYDWTLNE
jgi:hypothetical protein